MKADLHMHSKNSDGTKTIEELFKIAKEKGIEYISITDHDVCKNVEKAFEYSIKYGVKFIPGIELSTLEQGKPVHILGYFQDDSYNSIEMIEYYKMIREGRENRTYTFIEKLKEHFNIEISYEEVYGFSNGIIARPHIAKAIQKNYPEYSFDYIFDNFIGDHSKAYVPSTELSVKEGLALLKRNNCITSLAHPTLLKEHIKEEVFQNKFDCIEARYYRNKPGDEELYRKYAKDNKMLITSGSDYHGIENDSKHGMLGEVCLDGEDLKRFLEMFKPKFN